MHVFSLRAILITVALAEAAWGLVFYFDPSMALAPLGRSVVDQVILRQYPLYLASGAFAYLLAAVDPLRYARILWICVIQRAVEAVVACIDWRFNAIDPIAFLWIFAIEAAVALATILALRTAAIDNGPAAPKDPRDRGLTILLRCFGGLEIFWFLASTVFVQFGARLLHWRLQDAYTTEQQGIALLVIGLVSILAATDVARYRVFVWVPVFSQLIGVVNAFNEIHLGSITWTIAAIQWTIQLAIVFAFAWFSRAFLTRKAQASLPSGVAP